MSLSGSTTGPSFIFSDLSAPAKEKLERAFTEQNARQYLIVGTTSERDELAHGMLVEGTVIVLAAKYALPVLAGWLISLAPPKVRKESFEVVFPNGQKVTKTVEYSSRTSISSLVKLLEGILHSEDTQ